MAPGGVVSTALAIMIGIWIGPARPIFVMSFCPVILGAAWASNGIASVLAAAVERG